MAEREPLTVYVPSVRNDLGNVNPLLRLWSEVTARDGLNVTFDFSRCRCLRQHSVAFLGGLARLVPIAAAASTSTGIP